MKFLSVMIKKLCLKNFQRKNLSNHQLIKDKKSKVNQEVGNLLQHLLACFLKSSKQKTKKSSKPMVGIRGL